MALADLTLDDIRRVLSVRGIVRLTPQEAEDFRNASMELLAGAFGAGAPKKVDRQRLLAPLERTRDTLVAKFGEAYTADLIARLRR